MRTRQRFLAAATATVVALGMSLGGASVALATPEDETTETTETTEVVVLEGEGEGEGLSSAESEVVPDDVEGENAPPAVSASSNGSQKVFVCKYVGTPGVDESLQTGNNPISVSVNAIPDYQGVGSYFADAQGRSYVLAEDNRTGGGQEGEPSVSECPAPDVPEPAVMNITFMCKTVEDGPVLNTEYAGDSTEWDADTYIVRIRSDQADVPFQVKVGGTVIYEGVSIDGDLFFALESATGGMKVHWGDGLSKGTASTNENPCSYPEPEPAVMNITFMCKTVEDGPVLNTEYAGDSTEWDADTYIVRIRSDQADVPFQVKVGGTVIYEGVSIDGDLFFALESATGGMKVHWGDGLSKGTASTNENPCSYPEVEPTEVEPIVDVIPFDCVFGGSYTLPDVDGVVWTVGGASAEPGLYPVALAGTDVEIVASIAPDRDDVIFADGAQTEWSLAFEEPEGGCLETFPLVEPSASFTLPDCEDLLGTYTLSETEGVTWVVDGDPQAPGTYDAETGSTVEVEAVAGFGFGFAEETQTEWEFAFVPEEECTELSGEELPTLALTGASDLTGAFGLAALLITLTGMGMVVARRRVEA